MHQRLEPRITHDAQYLRQVFGGSGHSFGVQRMTASGPCGKFSRAPLNDRCPPNMAGWTTNQRCPRLNNDAVPMMRDTSRGRSACDSPLGSQSSWDLPPYGRDPIGKVLWSLPYVSGPVDQPTIVPFEPVPPNGRLCDRRRARYRDPRAPRRARSRPATTGRIRSKACSPLPESRARSFRRPRIRAFEEPRSRCFLTLGARLSGSMGRRSAHGPSDLGRA